ncbi:Spc98 family-domain-containing protein [Jimgerdemannia flammicorona]|uniref:Spc98 family-domain-containing protein n=1 Tax=Jimgerdemannia flammicorona TaxID=994334 RepID=A0A433QZG3_9FUNG|nr:Spc98 family-domain-containing protein [Jimgerdemannia flammicorona]
MLKIHAKCYRISEYVANSAVTQIVTSAYGLHFTAKTRHKEFETMDEKDHAAAWGNYTCYTDSTFEEPFDDNDNYLSITEATFKTPYVKQPLMASLLGLDNLTHPTSCFELPELSDQAFNVIDLAIPNIDDIDNIRTGLVNAHLLNHHATRSQPGTASQPETAPLPNPDDADVNDDLWVRAAAEPEDQEGKLLSWEAFSQRPGPREDIAAHGLPSPYLSEADLKTYEAVYQRHFRYHFSAPENIVKQEALIEVSYNLFAISFHVPFVDIATVIHFHSQSQDTVKLLIGTPTGMFQYNTKLRKFEPALPNIRIVGFSARAMAPVLRRFMDCGTYFKRLENVANQCKADPSLFGLTGSAFGHSLASYVSAMQRTIPAFIAAMGGSSKIAILKLYHSVEDYCIILERLADLCYCSVSAHPNLSPTEVVEHVRRGFHLPFGSGLLTHLYHAALRLDSAQSHDVTHKALLLTFLAHSSRPYLSMLDRWVGVAAGDGEATIVDTTGSGQVADPYSEFFVTNLDGEETSFVRKDGDAFWNDYFQMSRTSPPPEFLAPELARDVLEAGKSLRLLRECRPDHPLCGAEHVRGGIGAVVAGDVRLRWVMTHREIEEMHENIQMYVGRIVEAIEDLRKANRVSKYRRRFFSRDSLALDTPELLAKSVVPHIEATEDSNRRLLRDIIPPVMMYDDEEEPPPAMDMLDTIAHSDDGSDGDTDKSFDTSTSDHSLVTDLEDIFSIPSLSSRSSTVTTNTRFFSLAPSRANHNPSTLLQIEHLLQSESEPLNHNTLRPDGHIPPLQILADQSLSHPLRAHCRLINASVLSLFFHDLNLRGHLTVLRRYMLLGDGVFVSGLTESLFTDEIETGDEMDTAGKRAGIGLHIRLHSRQTWPPRGAELAMALKAVLLESIAANKEVRRGRKEVVRRKGEVEGLDDLMAFAVLGEEDDEGNEPWRDPHAVEALDFLYLSYRPPHPVNTIITPSSLDKYNRLFTFLLHILRVEAVVRRLYRLIHERLPVNATIEQIEGDHLLRRFRFEAHQFVKALYGYVFDVAIGSTWVLFTKRLDLMARRAMFGAAPRRRDEDDVAASSIGDDQSTVMGDDDEEEEEEEEMDDSIIMDLDSLRAYHDHVLDRMLFQCLLKRRQESIMKVVNGIFTVIITLARVLDDHREAFLEKRPTVYEEDEHRRKCRGLYDKFRLYAGMLVKILMALEEKGGGRMGVGVRKEAAEGLDEREAKYEQHRAYHDRMDTKSGVGGFLQELLLRLDFNGFYREVVAGEG